MSDKKGIFLSFFYQKSYQLQNLIISYIIKKFKIRGTER